MKNIHVLPTDKPSPLFYIDENLFYLPEEKDRTNWNKDLVKCQNIYITNDEEIKDGEYGICLNLVREGFKSHQAVFKMDAEQRQAMNELGGQKKAEVLKVILTDNPDLIKDGVQAIDDEFLEWICKNPSCEYVETVNVPYFDESGYSYLLIVPKEEPKQETLEEVAERLYPIFMELGNCTIEHDSNEELREAFIDGAKWQQQQNKNLYSEYEVYRKLHNLMTSIKLDGLVINDDMDLKKWFEQNKNK